MRRMLTAGSILFLAVLPLMAQTWETVRAVPAGTRVWVKDSSGQEHRGDVASVSEEAISLDTGRGQQSIERARVRRIEVRAPSRRLRNTLIGAGIGLGVGLLVDNTVGQYLRNETGESAGERAVTYIAPIGLFGGIGAAITPRKTIYRSK